MSRSSLLAECIREAPGLAWDTNAEGRPMTRDVVAGIAMLVRVTSYSRGRRGAPDAWATEATEVPRGLPEGPVWACSGRGATLPEAMDAACNGLADFVRQRERKVKP